MLFLRGTNAARKGQNMDDRILRLPAVKNITGLSRSLIYDMTAKGNFPAPILLGARAVGWLESEISGWISQKAESRRVSK